MSSIFRRKRLEKTLYRRFSKFVFQLANDCGGGGGAGSGGGGGG